MKVHLRNPTKFFNNKKIRVLKQFIQMLQNEVTLNKDVKITFEDTDSKAPMTTGVRLPNHDIRILAKNRILVDILRTIAHEWAHEYQSQKMGVKDTDKIQDIGGPEENMANILSGIFVKKFERLYPSLKGVLYN
jgi:hypothetical protein